jgi:hypothetical protein
MRCERTRTEANRWILATIIAAIPLSDALSRRGKSRESCHDQSSVRSYDNTKPRLAGIFYGRYWARTSDPQLVELVLSQLS